MSDTYIVVDYWNKKNTSEVKDGDGQIERERESDMQNTARVEFRPKHSNVNGREVK